MDESEKIARGRALQMAQAMYPAYENSWVVTGVIKRNCGFFTRYTVQMTAKDIYIGMNIQRVIKLRGVKHG